MTFNEDDDGQGKSSAGQVVFGIIWVEYQPDKLHGEANPEEEVELDETKEDLVVCIHGLDASICT